MPKRTPARPARTKAAPGSLRLTGVKVLPEGARAAAAKKPKYAHRYTTGPFELPQNPGSLDWVLLNNDVTPQSARVTVFQCSIGAAKIALPPGPLVVTLQPGTSTHNANTYPAGFIYEVQVECDSRLVFPYASVWPANFGVIIPGSQTSAGAFLARMP
jgi:hypothetical protein